MEGFEPPIVGFSTP